MNQYLLDMHYGYSEKAAKAHVRFRLFQGFERWYYGAQSHGDIDWWHHCNVRQAQARRVAVKFW